jgi:hypothetical protein
MAIKFLAILSILFFIALCFDGSVASTLKKRLRSCDCTKLAVQKCGKSVTSEARNCRNKSVYRCLRRIEKKVSRNITVKKLDDVPPNKPLRTFTKRVAQRRCGDDKECRVKVRREVREREIKFRRTVLKACDCKSRLSQRCQARLDTSKRCTRRYNRCVKRCLRRGCKIRARLECINNVDKSKCRRSVRRSCRRVNKLRRVRRIISDDINTNRVIIVREINLKRTLRTYCRRVARRRCGEDRACRIRVRREIRERELKFRRNSLNKCACKSKLSQRCQTNIHRTGCARKYNRCARRCLRKACRTRARTTCAEKKVEGAELKKCRRTHRRSCRRLHCRRIAIRKCGSGSVNKPCRTKLRREIREREINFRRTALKACACRSKLSKRCQEKLETSNKCARKFNKCAKRCLRKACRARARTTCAGKTEEKKCRRTHRRSCKRLHCGRHRRVHHKKTHHKKEHKKQKVTTVEVQTTTSFPHHHVTVQEHRITYVKESIKGLKTLPDNVLDDYCKRKSVEKCGSAPGHDNELCRNRVFSEFKNQEIVFRLSAVSHCKCDPNTSENQGLKLSSIANNCANTCIVRACKIRSSLECQTEKDQITCFSQRNLTCTTLHINK